LPHSAFVQIPVGKREGSAHGGKFNDCFGSVVHYRPPFGHNNTATPATIATAIRGLSAIQPLMTHHGVQLGIDAGSGANVRVISGMGATMFCGDSTGICGGGTPGGAGKHAASGGQFTRPLPQVFGGHGIVQDV
jgi:hypothetical protein